jgi:hypothetical protein
MVDLFIKYVGFHVKLNGGYTGVGAGRVGSGPQKGDLHQLPSVLLPFTTDHSMKEHGGVDASIDRALSKSAGEHVPFPRQVCQFGCSASASYPCSFTTYCACGTPKVVVALMTCLMD